VWETEGRADARKTRRRAGGRGARTTRTGKNTKEGREWGADRAKDEEEEWSVDNRDRKEWEDGPRRGRRNTKERKGKTEDSDATHRPMRFVWYTSGACPLPSSQMRTVLSHLPLTKLRLCVSESVWRYEGATLDSENGAAATTAALIVKQRSRRHRVMSIDSTHRRFSGASSAALSFRFAMLRRASDTGARRCQRTRRRRVEECPGVCRNDGGGECEDIAASRRHRNQVGDISARDTAS
jgi:hypothetical protein